MLRRIAALSATTKALTVAAAAAAGTTGVALTSNGVSIPGTLPGDVEPRPSASVHGPATPGENGSSGKSSNSAGTKTTGPGASNNDSPNPNLKGLCTAFQARAGNENDQGKALESSAFQELVEAAGGTANVEAFCVTLLGQEQETSKPKPTQAATGKPTDKRTGKPTDRRTGKPVTETTTSS